MKKIFLSHGTFSSPAYGVVFFLLECVGKGGSKVTCCYLHSISVNYNRTPLYGHPIKTDTFRGLISVRVNGV